MLPVTAAEPPDFASLAEFYNYLQKLMKEREREVRWKEGYECLGDNPLQGLSVVGGVLGGSEAMDDQSHLLFGNCINDFVQRRVSAVPSFHFQSDLLFSRLKKKKKNI